MIIQLHVFQGCVSLFLCYGCTAAKISLLVIFHSFFKNLLSAMWTKNKISELPVV